MTAKARASAKRDNNLVHRAADAHLQIMTLALRAAFNVARKALGKNANVDASVKALHAALLKVLPGILTKVFVAGANTGIGMLPKRRAASLRDAEFRTGPPAVTLAGQDSASRNSLRALDDTFPIRFDVTSPEAIAWAKEHAAELADGISETSRDDIKGAIAAALEGDGLDAAYDDILAAGANAGVGMLPKRMRAAGDVPGHEFHGNQWTGGMSGLPDTLYRGTVKGSFDETARMSTGGELGGGIYLSGDKEMAAGYGGSGDSQQGQETSLHEVTWARKPSDEEIGHVKGSGFEGTSHIVRGDGKEIWRQVSGQSVQQERAGMIAAAKEHGVKVLVGHPEHEGSGQISVLDKSLLKHVGTTSVRQAEAFRTFDDTFPIRFDVSSPEAIKWARDHASKIADDISQTSKGRINEAIASALEGDGLDAAYDDILAAVGDEARAEMIARTETMDAANEGLAQGWAQAQDAGLLPSDATKQWIATSDCCDECDEVDGEEVLLDDDFSVGDDPPLHPNCVLPGSVVSGRFVAGLRAAYSGPAREIETANGNRLRVTVNHVILTDEGWIPALRVRKGMKVFSHPSEVNALSGIDNYQRPIVVEDVFEALRLQGFAAAHISALDLHGDARWTDGHVEIVGAERRLSIGSQPVGNESSDKLSLPLSDARQSQVVGLRAGDFSRERIDVSASSSPRAAHLPDDCIAVLDEPLPLQVFLFGLASQWDVHLPEAARQDVAVNAAFVLELQKRSAGKVAHDEVVEVRDFYFSGHVYDLQSDCGFIIAQSIVISNCRCTMGIGTGGGE